MTDTEKLPPLILSFISYKLNIQNRSALTVSEYLNDLKIFFLYIAEKRSIDKGEREEELSWVDEKFCDSITAEEVYSFLLYLSNERKNKPVTRARRIASIRSFYKYHTSKSKLIKNNPVKDIETPTLKQKLPKHLSLDESLDLLSSLEQDSPTYERDFAILTLFLNCGMRLSELCGISLGDIDANMEALTVTGKGSKQRRIYLNSACRDAISAYLSVRQAPFSDKRTRIKDKNALFLSRLGKRISQKTVQWLVKKYLDAAGLADKKYSTHKLRHTAATLMYESGNVDVLVLKDILGHEQLTTTQIYTHISDKGRKKAMEENPLSKVKTRNIKKNPKDGTKKDKGTEED